MILWGANGGSRLIIHVDVVGAYTWSGLELDTQGDNSVDFVDIRTAHHAPTNLYHATSAGARREPTRRDPRSTGNGSCVVTDATDSVDCVSYNGCP